MNLRRAAELIQELLPHNECTHNLHVVTQHLREMHIRLGGIPQLIEMWIERLIGEWKGVVKFRTSENPEKVMVNHGLMKAKIEDSLEMPREREIV